MPTPIVYPLIPAVLPPPAPAALTSTGGFAVSRLAVRGILTPFRRDQKSDFATGTGLALIQSEIDEVLGTEVGEIAWNQSFGSKLHRLKHRNNVALLRELARAYTLEALGRWIPRVRLTDIEAGFSEGVTVESTRSALQLWLFYDVLEVGRGRVVAAGVEQSVHI